MTRSDSIIPLLWNYGINGNIFLDIGFPQVPACRGLMVATGMPLSFAIGRSLVAVTAFGAATATSYAYSGLVDWQIAALFTGGGFLGGLVGLRIGRLFAQRKQLLGTIFAFFVIWVGLYVLARGIAAANLLQRILS